MKEIIVKQDEAGRRLDKFLMKYLNKAPAALIYKLLRKKRIKLNGKRAEGNELISGGDTLQFFLASETLDNFMESRIIKKSAGIDVVYEDSNILLVNKPSGLLSHSNEKNGSDTLLDRVLYHLVVNNGYIPNENSSFTPALCNRLDRNTSGIVICGKTLYSVQQLNAAIAGDLVDKYYLAVVKGKVEKSGVLRGFHTKNGCNNFSNISNSERNGSKEAITEYEPLRKGEVASLIRIKLVTGRSHQIRVHMSLIGNPVIGDVKYGDDGINRMFKRKYGVDSQLLHAEKIRFRDMRGELAYLSGMEFSSDMPEVFGKIQYDTNG